MMINKVKKLIKVLKKRKFKIAIAESCTGGMLSSTITSVSGSSKVFTMGLVTYSNDSKSNLLNVSKKIINKNGSVSEQCCLLMVKNLSTISKSKICISITGIAGPKGGTKKKPVGLVYIGVKNGKKIQINKYIFRKKNRSLIQKATVNQSLNLLLKII